MRNSPFSLSKKFLDTSPRPVRFWECCLSVANSDVMQNTCAPAINTDDCGRTAIFGESNYYLDRAFYIYERINRMHSGRIPGDSAKNRRKKLFLSNPVPIQSFLGSSGDFAIREFQIDVTNQFTANPRISFANMRLSESNFLASIEGKPNLDVARYDVLSRLLKASRLENIQAVLLPECSVPYAWAHDLARFSAEHQILVVAGLEHWVANNISHNFLITVVPFTWGGVKDSVVLLRLKNHYSPKEMLEVHGRGLTIPKPEAFRYDLINWRGLYLAPYYCMELADIAHRTLFQSKVDLVVASEWNADVSYFSNIVESLSRDIHCYVAQVNNSKFGDSRLTQPSSTVKKDLLKLKGGLNDTILVGEIDYKLLRAFQSKKYALTRTDDAFKPVPPSIDRASVRKRQQNKLHF
ncbi:MAG TPA: hypothetical protein PLL77_11475 [Pyrinomonadaceae bacterium]|nr:hypothetical protein [Pyrinomonadaceae bacterium]